MWLGLAGSASSASDSSESEGGRSPGWAACFFRRAIAASFLALAAALRASRVASELAAAWRLDPAAASSELSSSELSSSDESSSLDDLISSSGSCGK